MTATITRPLNAAKQPYRDYVRAECTDCDWKGDVRPTRTVEGWHLAERDVDEHDAAHHGPLFEQVTEECYRCRACDRVSDPYVEAIPSMYAGTETYERCDRCGSTDATADPFKGTRRVTNAVNGRTYTYGA